MTDIFTFFTIQNRNDHFDFGLATIVISSVFWYIWVYVKSKRLFPPLPPGPRGLPIVGNLPFLHPELHTYFHSLAQKHGPVFKLWLGAKLTIVITSSEAMRDILRTNDIIFANHDVPVAGSLSTYGGVDIVWSPYGLLKNNQISYKSKSHSYKLVIKLRVVSVTQLCLYQESCLLHKTMFHFI